jgi:MFS family permease
MRAWQASFLLVALPGFIVGLLLLMLRSPLGANAANRRPAPPVSATLRYVRAHRRTFILFMIPGISALLMTFGVTFWIPATFQRAFGADPATAARSLGIWGMMNVTLGTLGALVAGLIVDRLRARYEHGYLILAFIGLLLPAISFSSFSLMPTAGLALIMLIPAALGLTVAPLSASCAITELAPAGMRALIFSGWMLAMSLLGMSLGPVAIGFLTQHLFGAPDGVRYAIPLLVVVTIGIGLPCLVLVKPNYVETARAAAKMEGRAA